LTLPVIEFIFSNMKPKTTKKKTKLLENILNVFDDKMFQEKSIPFMKGYRNGKKGLYKNPYKTYGFSGLYDRGYNMALNQTKPKKQIQSEKQKTTWAYEL
jgi:hypothetical protein